MKIGLFFGSFNPIHNGHLIISTYVTNFVANKVWFVVSPQNPFKKNSELLNITDRILLVKSAIKNDNQLKVSDVELKLPIPSYTINTLGYLKKIYPKHDFFIIMGSDNFLSISKWKAPDLLLKDYKFIIYQRPGFLIDDKNFPNNIRIINAPLINISSTEIRELIKTKKSVRYIVPDAVIKLIEKNKFYSKDN
ncbi:MAG TPA: nicotinate (nicotinamide) nucleotide adenylyltransferase [Parafilimonas sp.]|nr:nicotinate (nicotinamide) nucleotide adenylyltransferase [Parafilimonas sp.]